MQTRVNGSGELTSEITYLKKECSPSGLAPFKCMSLKHTTINGSGMITAKKAQAGMLTINGSGNIEWDYLKPMLPSMVQEY